MNMIGTIVIGIIAGLIARAVTPQDDRSGCPLSAGMGIIGALVGKFIGQAMGIYSSDAPAGFIGAIAGAVIVLAMMRTYRSHKRLSA